MIDTLVKTEFCTNCSACYNVCKLGAITVKEEGVEVDKDKCVECGLCMSVCTYLNPVKGNSVERCFAAWSRDDRILEGAASSGIVSTIAKMVIEEKGVVFGVRYHNQNLIFSRADSIDEIRKFQGSRYVQAYVKNIFSRIYQDLKQGRFVLFVGTPCQIAGLKAYLKKDYYNLLTIDLICHGVSKQEYLRQYVQNITKRTNWTDILFRGKDGIALTVYEKDKIVYKRKKEHDPFYMAYAKGLIEKECCYSCPYANLERMGDITLGDFWGMDRKTLQEEPPIKKEVSLVLINTQKGKEVFLKIKENNMVFCEERGIEEAVGLNRQLQHPIKRHDERMLFIAKEKKKGFWGALKKTRLYKRTNFNYQKYRIKRIFKKGD